jgi:hypothetical protein
MSSSKSSQSQGVPQASQGASSHSAPSARSVCGQVQGAEPQAAIQAPQGPVPVVAEDLEPGEVAGPAPAAAPIEQGAAIEGPQAVIPAPQGPAPVEPGEVAGAPAAAPIEGYAPMILKMIQSCTLPSCHTLSRTRTIYSPLTNVHRCVFVCNTF